MSLGSRLIVLLFVTKVLGTCTCSCTWLKKIDVLYAIQVLQKLFWTCTCKFEKYLTFTWLKYFRKYLTPTLPVRQSPCSFEICVPGRQKLWCAHCSRPVPELHQRLLIDGIDIRPKFECVLPWHMELILMLVSIKFTSARNFAPSSSSRCTRLWLA